MAGANPSYIARQLGHTNANMLFRVYSKWIDGADKSRERDKLNLGFGHDLATELIAEAKTFARSNTYLAEREGATSLWKLAFFGANTPMATPQCGGYRQRLERRTMGRVWLRAQG